MIQCITEKLENLFMKIKAYTVGFQVMLWLLLTLETTQVSYTTHGYILNQNAFIPVFHQPFLGPQIGICVKLDNAALECK